MCFHIFLPISIGKVSVDDVSLAIKLKLLLSMAEISLISGSTASRFFLRALRCFFTELMTVSIFDTISLLVAAGPTPLVGVGDDDVDRDEDDDANELTTITAEVGDDKLFSQFDERSFSGSDDIIFMGLVK